LSWGLCKTPVARPDSAV
jgi:Flp pilus assembly pilin Flp